MVYLILSTLFSAGFGLVVRFAQGRRCNMWAVGALNYATATLFNLVTQIAQGDLSPQAPTVIIGLLGGLSYVSAYFVLFKLMAMRGVAVSTTIVRLAVVIPIAVSIIFWGERPTAAQAVGSVLALISLPLLGTRASRTADGMDRRATVLLVLLFVLNGLNLVAIRAFEQTGIEGETSLFLTFLFGAAAIVSGVVWAFHREGTSVPDLLPGSMLGVTNALANITLVSALSALPGVIVFPARSALGVVISVGAARLFWHERITRLERAGIAVALGAAVFINL